MAALVFILFTILLIAGAVIAILSFKIRKNHQHRREMTIDLYKIRSDFSVKQGICDLYQSVFGSYRKTIRKSPVLLAAEEFKKKFNLGNFVVFCSDRNMFLPVMGVGFKLRSIKPVKVDLIRQVISGNNANSLRDGSYWGLPIDVEKFKQFFTIANMPNTAKKLFIFYYNFNYSQILFVGEDSQSDLAKYCIDVDFNRAVWPLLYNICRNNSNIKKQNEKTKAMQVKLDETNTKLITLSRKLKHKIIDLHSFYEISNNMFTVFDKKRLIEIFVNSVRENLAPQQVMVLLRDSDNTNLFKPAMNNGLNQNINLTLELSRNSDIYKLLATNNKVLLLPIVGSGLPKPDNFIESALSSGFSAMEKLTITEDIYGIVLIGHNKEGKPYGETDLELFSTLTNMASLALGNIHQYKLIEKMSYTDSMTKLYNYRYFYKRLNEEIFRGKRFNRMLALVIFDIDNFKTFNDNYGHQAGDEILKNITKLVTSSVRAIDVVSRYGGEEFCVIMPDTGFANSLIFIERLRKKIENHRFKNKFVKDECNITVSIGGAICPVDAQTADRLIYCSDMALLKAKADGRNRSMMFNNSLLEDKKLNSSIQQQLKDMRIHEDL
ncbi:MAG: GGDEF domain-containing protein [candidate division Zixibacteria bacterium]|nr:GGDEF domain-containing protein [candidate division Zixibacteria bacterium]